MIEQLRSAFAARHRLAPELVEYRWQPATLPSADEMRAEQAPHASLFARWPSDAVLTMHADTEGAAQNALAQALRAEAADLSATADAVRRELNR